MSHNLKPRPGTADRAGRSASWHRRENAKPLAHPELRNARKRRQRAAWSGRRTRVRARLGGADWPTVPDTVFAPLAGTGTVGLVAERPGRDSILIEISPDYVDMAGRRIAADVPLLAQPKAVA